MKIGLGLTAETLQPCLDQGGPAEYLNGDQRAAEKSLKQIFRIKVAQRYRSI
jgi:hypothetical protein